MNKFFAYAFLTAISIIIAFSTLNACPGTTFGSRFNTFFPLGEESKYTKTSFGFDIYGGYRFPRCPFETGINIRYIDWLPKDTYPGQTFSNTSWDFDAYCDYFWDDDDCYFEPYGGIQIGVHDWFSSYSYSYDGRTQTSKSQGGNLAYNLHIGTYYDLTKSIKLDLRLDYTGYTTKPTAQTGFGIGVGAKYIF